MLATDLLIKILDPFFKQVAIHTCLLCVKVGYWEALSFNTLKALWLLASSDDKRLHLLTSHTGTEGKSDAIFGLLSTSTIGSLRHVCGSSRHLEEYIGFVHIEYITKFIAGHDVSKSLFPRVDAFLWHVSPLTSHGPTVELVAL